MTFFFAHPGLIMSTARDKYMHNSGVKVPTDKNLSVLVDISDLKIQMEQNKCLFFHNFGLSSFKK